MWSIIVAIVVGFIAGLVARAIHPGDDKLDSLLRPCWGLPVHWLRPLPDVCWACTPKILPQASLLQ